MNFKRQRVCVLVQRARGRGSLSQVVTHKLIRTFKVSVSVTEISVRTVKVGGAVVDTASVKSFSILWATVI